MTIEATGGLPVLGRVLRLWRPAAVPLLGGAALALLATAALASLALAAGRTPLVGLGVAGAGVVLALRWSGLARVVLRYLERLATHGATFRALTALRLWLFRGLSARSSGGLGFLRRGDALARLVGDVDALDGLYSRILVPLASTILLLLVVAVLLGRQAPAVAAGVCVLLAAAALGVPWLAMQATRAEGRRLADAAAGLRVAVLDALGGMREVQAFGNEGRVLAQVQAREAAVFAAQRGVSRSAALAQAAATLLGQAALLLLVVGLPWAGASAAVLLPALLLTLAAFEAASAMPRAGALAGHAAAAAARVLGVVEHGPGLMTEPAGASLAVPPASGGVGVRFERVGFAWPGRPAVFEGLSLDVPPGSRVALLGPSGAGKSTLAALALKVVAPQSGRVLLGGVDLATLPAAAVRSRIAWLSQATHVFADTVRANLLLGRPGASDGALWQALAQAGLTEVIEALPQGLDTWVGEGGAGLSGGQSRRLALARALLSEAPVLILDEPATGLDDAAERAFFLTLNTVAPERTVILIVHRLLGVERLDRIWRLSGGRAIAATG